jgi:hypothetical protein
MKSVLLPKIFKPYFCSNLIRLGKNNDGGYLVNKFDVDKTENLFTFGIGEDISFEDDFLKINDSCVVCGYDGTTENIHSDFFIENRYFNKENVTSFNIEKILNDKENIFLNCDIDGGEYNILSNLIVHSNKFSGLTIEFHDISKPNNLNELINFIGKFELRLIHIHINNYTYIVRENNTFIPDVIELSFSSSKENTELRETIILPNDLDMPNNPMDDEFRILF